MLRGRHVMVLAHARRSLGLNRLYDIVLNRESSNIICNQFCRMQNQLEKRTAMAKFWSRTMGYVSVTAAAYLLQAMPEPSTPSGRNLRHEAQELIEQAAVVTPLC